MPVYLLNADGDEGALVEIEQHLKPAIPDLKRVAAIDDIRAPLLKGAGRSIAILVPPSAEKGKDLAGLIDIVNKRHRDVFFIVVGGDLSAKDYKQLIQSGNADWVAESGAAQEILGIVARVGAARPGVANHSIVVSFLPSAGGVGNSTLAIETAIQLVRRKPAKDGKIALVDLDFQSSHVCDYLDVAPKFQIEEIIDEPGDSTTNCSRSSPAAIRAAWTSSPRRAIDCASPLSASKPCRRCSSAWPITMPGSSSICRSPPTPGRFRS